MEGPTAIRRRITALGLAAILALAAGAVALVLALGSDEPAPQRLPAAVGGGGRETSMFTDAPVPRDAALAPGSAAMVAGALLPYAGTANLAGSAHWGIPIVRAAATDPVRRVTTFAWAVEPGRTLTFRIPDDARPSAGSDHHLAVIDGNRELDLWTAERDDDGNWHAGAAVVVSRTDHGVAGPIAANAAGFALAAGVVRRSELAAGRIDHALTFTTPSTRDAFVAPAVHTDGRRRDAGSMPLGTRIQLDPGADLSGLSRTERIIGRALQVYGAYLVDSSDSLAIRAETGTDGGTTASLTAIPWSRMRVLAP